VPHKLKALKQQTGPTTRYNASQWWNKQYQLTRSNPTAGKQKGAATHLLPKT
jgi:hypothetical protein